MSGFADAGGVPGSETTSGPLGNGFDSSTDCIVEESQRDLVVGDLQQPIRVGRKVDPECKIGRAEQNGFNAQCGARRIDLTPDAQTLTRLCQPAQVAKHCHLRDSHANRIGRFVRERVECGCRLREVTGPCIEAGELEARRNPEPRPALRAFESSRVLAHRHGSAHTLRRGSTRPPRRSSCEAPPSSSG